MLGLGHTLTLHAMIHVLIMLGIKSAKRHWVVS